MNATINAYALTIARLAARAHGWEVEYFTVAYAGGGEGYSIHVRQTERLAALHDPVVLRFHNSDQFGPRWTGLAGRVVPQEFLLPYIAEVAKNPTAHSGMVNRILPDQT